MLTDVTQTVLARALDGSALRHRAIADNIANVETPGYRRQEVRFEEALRSALGTPDMPVASATFTATQERAVEQVTPQMATDTKAPVREDGNTVDPEREMVQLAENTVQYQAVLQSLNMKIGMLKSAIHEGRR